MCYSVLVYNKLKLGIIINIELCIVLIGITSLNGTATLESLISLTSGKEKKRIVIVENEAQRKKLESIYIIILL